MINNDIEKLLHDLPRFNRSQRADDMFYEKLNGFTEASDESAGFFGLFVRRFAFGTAAMALVAFFATATVAYRSDVVHGNLLYPLKEYGESVELAFAFSAEDKVNAHIRFSDRRLEEANSIISRYPAGMSFIPVAFAENFSAINLNNEDAKNLDLTLSDMHTEIAAALDIAGTSEMEDDTAEKVIAKIETAVERHVQALDGMEKRTGDETKNIIRKVSDGQKGFAPKVKDVKEKAKTKMQERKRRKTDIESHKIEKSESQEEEKSVKKEKEKVKAKEDDKDESDQRKRGESAKRNFINKNVKNETAKGDQKNTSRVD